MPEKLTKESVNFGNGMIHSHCGKVFPNDNDYYKHYSGAADVMVPGKCSIVEGDIRPTGWCERFERVSK